jgi:hypothetical protein
MNSAGRDETVFCYMVSGVRDIMPAFIGVVILIPLSCYGYVHVVTPAWEEVPGLGATASIFIRRIAVDAALARVLGGAINLTYRQITCGYM